MSVSLIRLALVSQPLRIEPAPRRQAKQHKYETSPRYGVAQAENAMPIPLSSTCTPFIKRNLAADRVRAEHLNVQINSRRLAHDRLTTDLRQTYDRLTTGLRETSDRLRTDLGYSSIFYSRIFKLTSDGYTPSTIHHPLNIS